MVILPRAEVRPITPRLVVAVAWVWLAVAVLCLTDAACDVFVRLALWATASLLGLTWLAVTFLHRSVLRKRSRVWWLSVPSALALAVVLARTDVDLAVRVALCEGSLSRFADGVTPDTARTFRPRFVGLFRVDRVDEFEGGVYLFTSSSFMNSHGVARIPNGARIAPRMRVRRLYGDWHSFEWKF